MTIGRFTILSAEPSEHDHAVVYEDDVTTKHLSGRLVPKIVFSGTVTEAHIWVRQQLAAGQPTA